jgi:hypothetical protein
MKGKWKFEFYPSVGQMVRECQCGNQLFYLTTEGYMCANFLGPGPSQRGTLSSAQLGLRRVLVVHTRDLLRGPVLQDRIESFPRLDEAFMVGLSVGGLHPCAGPIAARIGRVFLISGTSGSSGARL